MPTAAVVLVLSPCLTYTARGTSGVTYQPPIVADHLSSYQLKTLEIAQHFEDAYGEVFVDLLWRETG